MVSQEKNFAFIDCTNVYLGIKTIGWELDFRKMRTYLSDKYCVQKAYLFLGYNPSHARLYTRLQEYGYILVFKPILTLRDGTVKGNCDAELVLQVMIDIAEYNRAVIVSGDGDFHCLIQYLLRVDKYKVLLAPSQKGCSSLLKRLVGSRIQFLSDMKSRMEYIKSTP